MTLNKRIVLLALILSVLVVLYFLNPMEQPLMPKCLIKMITGYSCPGCGVQRATHAVLHGRFSEAITYNYWYCYSLPYLFAVIIERLLPKNRWQQKAAAIIEHPVLIYTYIITFFVWFIVRNILHI